MNLARAKPHSAFATTFLCATVLLCSFSDAPSFAIPFQVQEETLPSGLKVLIVERHDSPTVYCGLFFRVGSVNERPGITGLSHLIEHMMFKGTKTLGTSDPFRDAEYNAAIDKLALQIRGFSLKESELQWRGRALSEGDEKKRSSLQGEMAALVAEQKKVIVKDEIWKLYLENGGTGLNASTGNDSTQYFVQLPSNKVELFFWIESDRFQHPVFREFYSEREVVKEERRLRMESAPGGLAEESFDTLFWGAHPYQWPVVGRMGDLDTMTLDDAEHYFRTYYRPSNAVAVFVGDVKSEEIARLARLYLGKLKNDSIEPPPVPAHRTTSPGERRMTSKTDAPNSVEVRFHTVARLHDDCAPLTLISSILNGMSGRLHNRLVKEKKLAVSASAYSWNLPYGGIFSVTVEPADGVDHEKIEDAIDEELEDLKRELVGERELQKAKNRRLADIIDDYRSNGSIGAGIASAELFGSWKDIFARQESIGKVTADDIRRTAAKYLDPSSKYVHYVKRTEKGERR